MSDTYDGYELSDLLSEADAAAKFGRSKFWLRRLRKRAAVRGEKFPARKIGNTWFYFGRELASWVITQDSARDVTRSTDPPAPTPSQHRLN